jgi:glycopeptide antibiotics resistance protein
MKKRIVSIIVLLAYIALLIKVMVFKDIPAIKIGQIMLNFGGTDAGHGPNFIPFATIGPYLLGYKGWIIAGINLIGNIALLVPLGFFLPLVLPRITWKQSLIFAAASGLVIETLQTILHVGIFDIDDVILNALGFMLGYFAFRVLTKWLRERKYIQIVIATVLVLAAGAAMVSAVYPWGQPVVNPGVGAGGDQADRFGDTQAGEVPQIGDLCGGTGGNGQIVSVSSSSFTMKRNDGAAQTVNLSGHAMIKTSAGPASVSDLKAGERVTLVGGPEADGSFTADAVFVCS